MNQKQLEKEWQKMEKTEASYINKNLHRDTGAWLDKISEHVPDKFERILRDSFCKAFGLIFDKGLLFIEKTYNKEKKKQDYKILEFAAEIKNNSKTVKAFSRKAAKTKVLNGAISTVEGVGMGVLGMGIPDIPLFLGVLLKSIYEIALSYGFTYESEKEQIFILKMMETALLEGQELIEGNENLNGIIDKTVKMPMDRESQIKATSDALAREMLYLKFVQGIPIVGIVGGLADIAYQRKLTQYAELKYKRRFYNKAKEKSV